MTNYCPCLLTEPKQTDVNRTSFSKENRHKLPCDEEGTFSPLADTFVFLCDAVRFCAWTTRDLLFLNSFSIHQILVCLSCSSYPIVSDSKHLMTGPEGEQWILFPENLNVSLDFVSRKFEIQGKQNSLFPKGQVIKWFVVLFLVFLIFLGTDTIDSILVLNPWHERIEANKRLTLYNSSLHSKTTSMSLCFVFIFIVIWPTVLVSVYSPIKIFGICFNFVS